MGSNGDIVYPLHMLDDTKGCRDYFVALTFRFNDVLDAEKLGASLSRLLEIGDWKKLGGRLQLNKAGKLESHVPAHFTTDQPAIAFSHNDEHAKTPISEHPLASTLPKATPSPTIQPLDPSFTSFITGPDVPTTMDEMITRATPQIFLRITSFADATLMGLVWPHTMMDALGLEDLLRAWSIVLAGREGDVPALLGASEDVLANLGDEKDLKAFKGSELMSKHQLGTLAQAAFFARYVKDSMGDVPVVRKLICLPKAALAELHDQAVVEDEKAPFVSESDILTAWAARAVAKSKKQPRPVTIASAVNIRFRLASLLGMGDTGRYMQNMVLNCFTFLPSDIAQSESLRPIAETHRGFLGAQTTVPHTLGMLRFLREKKESGKDVALPLFGEAKSVVVIVNNLTKVNMMQAADFGPAVVGKAQGNGKIAYWHFLPLQPPAWMKDWFVVLGKDHEENCWVMATLGPKGWEVIEEELEMLK